MQLCPSVAELKISNHVDNPETVQYKGRWSLSTKER